MPMNNEVVAFGLKVEDADHEVNGSNPFQVINHYCIVIKKYCLQSILPNDRR